MLAWGLAGGGLAAVAVLLATGLFERALRTTVTHRAIEALAGFAPSGLVTALDNTAEVMAGVLAITITVVAIVTELAANRYTHRITQLFVRDPVNIAVMAFLVAVVMQALWVPAWLAEAPPSEPVAVAGAFFSLALVTASLLILLPYFAYVFWFLSPHNVVRHMRRHVSLSVERAATATGGRLQRCRKVAVAGIEELEEVASNSLEHKDRGIAMACVEAMAEILRNYRPFRERLPEAWFRIDGDLAQDPDFVAVSPSVLASLEADTSWFEMKLLRQYHAIYCEALHRGRDVAHLIALDTRRIASELSTPSEPLFELCVRFFNSYLRAAINANDVRTAYYVIHQYRQLAEDTLGADDEAAVGEIAVHLRYYGLLAYAQRLPFLLEAVAYDLSQLVERALEKGMAGADALLEVFLSVDKESESPAQEHSLHGVRRVQVQLAAGLLERGDEARARRIFDDMVREQPARLRAVRAELLAPQLREYWEVTDRGVNFAWLPPERRPYVIEFFSWFGDTLPAAE
jgi:hypothetical protein